VASPIPLRPPTLRDIALIVFLGTIWGSSFFFIKIAVAEIPPLTIATGRIGLAALLLFIYIRLRGRHLPRERAAWRWLVPTGILNSAVPFFLIGQAETTIDSSLAALLMSAGPIWALILSHFFTVDDRFTRNKALGVAIGFGGVIAVLGPVALLSASGTLVGAALLVTANICYTGSGIMVRKVQGVPSDVFGAAATLAGFCAILPVCLVVDQPWTLSPSAGTVAAVFYLGLVGTAFAAIIRFKLLMEIGATFFSQIGYIITISGVLFGAILLSEPVSINMVGGMVLIFLGIYVSQRRKAQTLKGN
jgi:drug/metabolite transporter (DMT)-like permease